ALALAHLQGAFRTTGKHAVLATVDCETQGVGSHFKRDLALLEAPATRAHQRTGDEFADRFIARKQHFGMDLLPRGGLFLSCGQDAGRRAPYAIDARSVSFHMQCEPYI